MGHDRIGRRIRCEAGHRALVEDEKKWHVYEPPKGEPEPVAVDFKSMFLEFEDDEEQSSSLASVLDVCAANGGIASSSRPAMW